MSRSENLIEQKELYIMRGSLSSLGIIPPKRNLERYYERKRNNKKIKKLVA